MRPERLPSVAQQARVLASHDSLSLISMTTWQKERTDSPKLFSDHYIGTVAYTCEHRHARVHTHNKNTKNNNNNKPNCPGSGEVRDLVP